MSAGFGRRVGAAAAKGLWDPALRAREIAMGSIDDKDVGVREGVREEEGDDLVSLSFFELNFRNMFMFEWCE